MSGTKIIEMFFVGVLMSFFFFPFEFTFLPGINTKMAVAVCGLVLLFFRLAKKRQGSIDRDFFFISLLALSVSLVCIVTMTYNNTNDASYLGYIVSMWVWTGAAYFVVRMIKSVHGKVSVELVCFYLIAVGVAQCLIAIAINTIPLVKAFIYSFLAGEGFMGKTERTHGIGCALDVGGGRLGAILIMISFMLPQMNKYENGKKYQILLLFAYCLIAVIGNMIGRTASVGMLLSLVYILYALMFEKHSSREERKNLAKCFCWVLGISVCFLVMLYNTNTTWKEHLRFGFEGFFSLVEKGQWEVQSNDMLLDGYVFPDNLKTWIIGDGYMADPEVDPYYTGPSSWGFYMNTDAGYCRFLFYFGVIGLGVFSLFFIKVCQSCMLRFPNHRMMFLMLLLLNFLIWIKVATDIYLVFAPFLCVSWAENEEYEEKFALG